MGYDVQCKMLALIVGTEIPSTLIRSTTAKIVRIVKTADKLIGCKKDEYLKEIFKLSENIDLGNNIIIIVTDILKTGIMPACTLNMRVKLNSASPNYVYQTFIIHWNIILPM